MDASLIRFGLVEIEGRSYDRDVVIDGGRVSKRVKKASKVYRAEYGHTPLSAAERLPWGGERLIVGTGAYGSLPIMPEVYREAEERGVEIVAVDTERAIELIRASRPRDVHAVLHITC